MRKSTSFYKDVIGLPLKSKSKTWVEFFSNGTVLALHPQKKKSGPRNGAGMLVGFMVSDLDSTVEQLKKKKVKFFKKPKEESFGKHTIVLDPDNHMISIVQLTESSSLEEGFDLFGMIGAE